MTAIPVIRRVGVAYAAVVSALHGECFDEAWSEEAISSLLQTPGTEALMASVHGGPQGFALFRVTADEAEILAVGVRPQARRTRIGQQLLTATREHAAAAGANRLILEVADDNMAARRLYTASGFTNAGLRKDYYVRPSGLTTDALILECRIATADQIRRIKS